LNCVCSAPLFNRPTARIEIFILTVLSDRFG
jgi:hypothetical protein